jgi:hypothetical protein
MIIDRPLKNYFSSKVIVSARGSKNRPIKKAGLTR